MQGSHFELKMALSQQSSHIFVRTEAYKTGGCFSHMLRYEQKDESSKTQQAKAATRSPKLNSQHRPPSQVSAQPG